MFKLKNVLVVFIGVLLLAVIVWLGASFYLMKTKGDAYVAFLVNLENENLSQFVEPDFPISSERYISYTFPVKFWSFKGEGDSYLVTFTPSDYGLNTTLRTSERFEYSLKRNANVENIDVAKLESGTPLLLTLRYDISRDLGYFIEYAVCTAKKEYANLLNIDSPCSRGNCIVNRQVVEWKVEVLNKSESEKLAFLKEYDKDTLVKRLTNYFLTDDLGYFQPTSFKYLSTQHANSDGTYQFSSKFIKDKDSAKSLDLISHWFVSGITNLISKGYEDYKDIDLISYLGVLNEYMDKETTGKDNFLNCQVAYNTVSSLKDCSENICDDIRSEVFNYCKRSLTYAEGNYQTESNSYQGYTVYSYSKGYLFGITSEMVYFNKLIDELELTDEKKYNVNTLDSYFNKGIDTAKDSSSLMSDCYLLKASSDIYSLSKDNKYKEKSISIYNSLPTSKTICEVTEDDELCSLSIAEQLVCADALSVYENNNFPMKEVTAEKMLSDIFFKYYYESAGALKMQSYENLRTGVITPVIESEDREKLEEYGYFVSRREFIQSGGKYVVNSANLIDSYYFVYLLEQAIND